MPIKIMKYKKRPIQVEAVQFDGTIKGIKYFRGLMRWMGYSWFDGYLSYDEVSKQYPRVKQNPNHKKNVYMVIKTPDGNRLASPGDFVVKDIFSGGFYTVKANIFEETHLKE